MGERRRSSRRKSFLRGCIYFNNRRSAIDCLVRDLSAAGARLIFSAAVNVPDVVDLYIPQKERRCAHRCSGVMGRTPALPSLKADR